MITLTNGVQIPENAVQLQTTAAIDGYYVTQPLRLVQYDETLPVAAVQLTYQNQPYIPPTGAELNVRMGKPDGTTVYNPCLGMDSSGIVYFAFTQQMTIVAGTGTLTVEITDSGVKNSAPIIAEIRPNPVPEGSIESADEFLTLQEILAEAEKWGQIVQTNASNIQQVVDNLEDIQNAAENAQAAAASAAAAQQAAQEALGFRTFFSAVTPDANGNLDPSRPMAVGPAASVEIESAGDRIQSVTALGFTTQAGSGDPSPSNVRAITNGGIRLTEFVLDGDAVYSDVTVNANTVQFNTQPGAVNPVVAVGYCEVLELKSGNTTDTPHWFPSPANKYLTFYFPIAYFGGKTDKPSIVAALNENPVKVWYQDAGDTGSLYAPIILTSGEYRATCLLLTAPLCEGDSVVSWVKSGCDKVVTFDGSENWVKSATGFYIAGPLSDFSGNSNGYCDQYPVSAVKSVSGTVYWDSAAFSVYDASYDSLESFKAALAANPMTVWYRSTNYTEAADIPVSLETHQQAALVLDGTEPFVAAETTQSGKNRFRWLVTPAAKKTDISQVANIYCSHYKAVQSGSANGGTYGATGYGISVDNYGNIFIYDSNHNTTTEDFKAYLAAQYAAGTPVTIVYELATPITYAHEAVVLEAATGDQLTYTVTGQSGGTVSVALKPFQDGGHAATADNAQQLDGLTLLAIKESMTPVGYIFSWAPVGDGPDLSTPAKVAAYFGFGTWAAYGTGQVLVGVDSGQTEFATVGKTGGEKTHKLTTSEVPPQNVSAELDSTPRPVMVDAGVDNTDYGCTFNTDKGYKAKPATKFQTKGGGQAHNNLQPYITVYRWQRVA